MIDENYIQGFLANNQELISKFYEECHNRFISYFVVNYKKSGEYAQDLFHESFIIMCENIQYGKITEQSLKTSLYWYLVGIGKIKMKANDRKTGELKKARFDEYVRRVGKNSSPVKVDAVIADIPDEEELAIEREVLMGIVETAYLSLGQRCKDLLMYHIVSKLPQAEIAKRMNFSNAESVKTQKHKCMEKLKLKANSLNS